MILSMRCFYILLLVQSIRTQPIFRNLGPFRPRVTTTTKAPLINVNSQIGQVNPSVGFLTASTLSKLAHLAFNPQILNVNLAPQLLAPAVAARLLGINVIPEILSLSLNPQLLSPAIATGLLGIFMEPQILRENIQPQLLSPELAFQLLGIESKARVLVQEIKPCLLGGEMKFHLMKINANPNVLTSDISPNLLCPHIFGQLLKVNLSPNVGAHSLSPSALSPALSMSLLEIDPFAPAPPPPTTGKKRRKRSIQSENAPVHIQQLSPALGSTYPIQQIKIGYFTPVAQHTDPIRPSKNQQIKMTSELIGLTPAVRNTELRPSWRQTSRRVGTTPYIDPMITVYPNPIPPPLSVTPPGVTTIRQNRRRLSKPNIENSEDNFLET